MRRLIGLLVAVTAITAACGGKAPTAPSEDTGLPGSGGSGAPAGSATITGAVQGPASAATAVSSGSAIAGVTVSVIGTSISSVADAAGRFTLAGVPAGNVQLQFSGGGANATLSLGTVEPSQSVDLVVSVSGSTAAIESQVRTGPEAQLEGKIDALPPTTAALTFKAAGRTVTTDSSTQFTDGGVTRAFADLRLGMRVHVKGTITGDVFNARRVELQSPQVDPVPAPTTPPPTTPPPGDTSASIHGTLKSIGGSQPALVLLVDTTTVRTSSSTEVKRRGDVQTLDALKVGMSVHVVGDRQSDGSLNARKIEINDDATGGEFEIEGSMGGLKGTCPAIAFGVNGFSIAANGSTVFDGTACSAFKNGDRVQVKGLRQADGSVLATRVKKQ